MRIVGWYPCLGLRFTHLVLSLRLYQSSPEFVFRLQFPRDTQSAIKVGVFGGDANTVVCVVSVSTSLQRAATVGVTRRGGAISNDV